MHNVELTAHCFCQVMAKINVRFEFGEPTRPSSDDGEIMRSACLVEVYAMSDIESGEELYIEYGPDFWADEDTSHWEDRYVKH
jgi:hypothetical protein